MKKKLLACLLLLMLLLSPHAHADAPDEYAVFCEGRLFADSLPDEALEKPPRVLARYEDMVYALDYLAFYRVDKPVWFDIDAGFAESFFNPYTVFQKAYREADLADVYACQLLDSYYSRYHVIAIDYSISRDIASLPPETVPAEPVIPSFDYAPTGEAELPIPIEQSGRVCIPCENGEQLYYLAMNGYRPVPVSGSRAEALYSAACEVIRQRIRPEQTDFEKIRAIYDYLTTEVVYDRETAYSTETYLVREQAYYLEGVFFNRCAVCDGKAKAYALLLNLLEIPCWRETGMSGFADHAWNLVELDGKTYLSCATYGQSHVGALGRILSNYSMLLAGRETPYGAEWGYVPQKHPDIAGKVEERGYDVYAAMDCAGLPLQVTAMEELEALLTAASQCGKPEYKVEFQYTGTDKAAFQADMIAYLEQFEHINALEVKSEGGAVYQVIYLQEP